MPRHRSASPPRRSRGETTPAPGSSGGGSGAERGLVIHRVTKEVSTSGAFPTLTKTNYFDWAALMRVMLQARGLWVAVSTGTTDFVKDRMALEVIAKAVPTEMMGAIASKATAKAAWDAISTMHVGVERVRKAKANTLRREFDGLKFRDGETVDEFSIRINRIAHQLAVLNDSCTEEEIVRKFLQALPLSATKNLAAYGYGSVAWKERMESWKQKQERLHQMRNDGGGKDWDGDGDDADLSLST